MRSIRKISFGVLLACLFCIQSQSLDFPRRYTVTTTRDVLKKHGSSWGMQLEGIRNLQDGNFEVTLLIRDEEDMNQLKSSGVLDSERLESHRNLQGEELRFEDLPCYRTVEETFNSMDSLAAQYPGFVVIKPIGVSWLKQQGEGGHDIKVMRITAPNDNNDQKDDLVVVGGHHGRELPPPEALMRWGEYLLSKYGKDADITWILNRTIIHLVPLANPDGREIVQQHMDWSYRKNAHSHGCSEASLEGVDLNRNYPMWWGEDSGSSGDPCRSDFRGEGPKSEPEVRAIYSYASRLFSGEMKKGTPEEAQMKANEACPEDASGIFMDVHSAGNFVYFPWGYKDVPLSPNHESLLTMASKLAKPGNYSLWGPRQDGFLYYVSGDATDAFYGIDCVASFGYEIGTDVYASCEEFAMDIVPVMEESLLYAAKCVSAPYTIPMGPDIMNIKVDNSDPDSTIFHVEVSVDAKIVPHAKFESKSDNAILSVQLYVDEHPYDAGNSAGIIMMSEDGLFASADEVATHTLDTSSADWEGRHIFYFLATDREGYDGPVSAIFVDYPETSAPVAPTEGKDTSVNVQGETTLVLTDNETKKTTDAEEAGQTSSGTGRPNICLVAVATIGMVTASVV